MHSQIQSKKMEESDQLLSKLPESQQSGSLLGLHRIRDPVEREKLRQLQAKAKRIDCGGKIQQMQKAF